MSQIPMLLRWIHPSQLTIPPSALTSNGALYDFTDRLLRPGLDPGIEVFMLCDVVQCILTCSLCCYTMLSKGRARKISLFSLRRSPHGTFIVPNAVCVLLLGVCLYLAIWSGYCSFIVAMQRTKHSYAHWLWFIPYPWLPLAIGAFLSAYGFALTCSPRSPISNFNASPKTGLPHTKFHWMYLPIPHSAWIMNTFVVGVTAIMIVWNTVVHSCSLYLRQQMARPARDFYGEVLSQPHTQAWRDEVPSPALVDFARVAWCDLINIYRFCCLGYLSYVALLCIILLISILYAVPNHIYLIDHLCSIFPGPYPEGCKEADDGGLLQNLRLLRKLGLPRNLKGSKYHAFKKMWMVTMVGHSQAVWLINGAVLFLFIPLWLTTAPWGIIYKGKGMQYIDDLSFGYVITVAFLTAFWITFLSATMTLDDIFRAVSGLGLPKSALQTNDQETGFAVLSQQSMSRYQVRSLGSFPPSSMGKDEVGGGVASPKSKSRTVSFLAGDPALRTQPSFSSLGIAVESSTDEEKELDEPNHDGIRVTVVTETTASVG